MSKKINRVSIRKMEEAINLVANDHVDIEWNGVSINITPTISFDNMIRFIINVIDGCFIGDEEMYVPEAKSFMIRVCTIAYYTNISLPQNINNKYKFAYDTDLFETILQHINDRQFKDILDAIEERIYVKTSSADAIAKKELASMQIKLNEFADNITALFEGVGKEDISNIIEAINNGSVDEDKLMDAYIKTKTIEANKEIDK